MGVFVSSSHGLKHVSPLEVPSQEHTTLWERFTLTKIVTPNSSLLTTCFTNLVFLDHTVRVLTPLLLSLLTRKELVSVMTSLLKSQTSMVSTVTWHDTLSRDRILNCGRRY